MLSPLHHSLISTTSGKNSTTSLLTEPPEPFSFSFTSPSSSLSRTPKSDFVKPNARRADRRPKTQYLAEPIVLSCSRPSLLSITSTATGASSLGVAPTSHSSSSASLAMPNIMPAPIPSVPHWSLQQAPRADRPNKRSGNEFKSVKRVFSSFGLQSSAAKAARKAAVEARSTSSSSPAAREEPSTILIEKTQKLSLAEQVMAKSRKIVGAVRRKLSSKSPASELPQTWEEYAKAYARYEIDVEDPPLPPMRESIEGAGPTPYEARAYVAPKPHNEAERQAVVDKLDLFGTKNKQASGSTATLSISMPSSAAMAPNASSSSSLLSPSEASSSRPTSMRPDSLLRRGSFGSSSLLSTATSTPTEAEKHTAAAVASLENYPAFRAIVQRCQKLFDVRVGMLTVLDEEQQLFLATGGLPEAVEQGGALPRAVTFCSHAILNEERGMVVLDSQNDWRFANALPSAALGARFYAGVPLLAPKFGDPDAPNVAIGTLCAVDDRPHDAFTEEQRCALQNLASEASECIEAWVNERMSTKLHRLEDAFAQSTATLPSAGGAQENEAEYERDIEPRSNLEAEVLSIEPAAAPTPVAATPKQPLTRPPRAERRPRPAPSTLPSPQIELPATPPESFRSTRKLGSISHSRNGSDAFSDTASTSSSVSSDLPTRRRPSAINGFSLAITTEDPVTAIPKDLQKVFDQATRMLAKALALDLVYLVSLDLAMLNAGSNSAESLRVLSSHGMPSPAPAFDPALHLKALRAPEGGLLYSNPRHSAAADAGPGYSGGILIPVLEVRRIGYVLCGYSKSATRQFHQKDLTYFVKFSEQLETYVTKLGRTSGAQLALEE